MLSQTHTRWVALVVDDGSSEDLAYVERLDPRISLLRQQNEGLTAARNAGIRATSASLIAFLDADDLWLPRKLELQVELMAASDPVLCSTDFEIIDGNGTRIGPGYGGAWSFADLLEGCGLCVSTVMVRRSALDSVGLFDLQYRQAQDWDLWLRLAKTGPLGRCDEVLARYRIHAANMSRNYRRLLDEGTSILRSHQADRDSHVCAAAERGIRNLRRLVGAQAYDAFKQHHRPTDLVHAFRLAPRSTLNQIRLFAANRIRPKPA